LRRVNRSYTLREQRLVAEYVLMRWPDAKYVGFRIHVGALPAVPLVVAGRVISPEIFRPTQRWVDAMVITKDDWLYLVEGTVWDDIAKISQLKAYARLASRDPRWNRFFPARYRLLLLCAMPSRDLEEFAKAEGIHEVVFYTPDWIVAHLKSLVGGRRYLERTVP